MTEDKKRWQVIGVIDNLLFSITLLSVLFLLLFNFSWLTFILILYFLPILGDYGRKNLFFDKRLIFKLIPVWVLITLLIDFRLIFIGLFLSLFSLVKDDRKRVAILSKRDDLNFLGLERFSDDKDCDVIVADDKYYDLISESKRVLKFDDVYEDIFERSCDIEIVNKRRDWVYDIFKRFFDIVASSFFIILTIPLYPLISLAIAIETGFPIIIKQKRVGLYGKVINVYKFRSMKVSDGGVWVKESDPRITDVGQFLRKSRLDEIPQFFNVLKGEMSLFGPRPDILDLKKELENEIEWYNMRGVVMPGLTGWAQVNQLKPPQSVSETRERQMYDIYYIKHRSLSLDIDIFFKTLKVLIFRDGV